MTDTNVVFESATLVDKEVPSEESENARREWDESDSELKMLFVHVKIPDPIDRMEEVCVSEADVSSISRILSIPIDVIVQRGEGRDTLSLLVKESRMSKGVDRYTPNPSFTTSYTTADVASV